MQTEEWPCPVHRLQGPPGTGKTYTLTRSWIPRAVDLYGENAVLVCSLTRAAAHEIGGRANLPRENVATLHAFAYRALGKPPLAQDRGNVAKWNEIAPHDWHLTGTTKPGKKDEVDVSTSVATDGDGLLDRITIMRSKMIPSSQWEPQLRAFWSEWLAWKREHQWLDFTDLIWAPVEFNVPPPGNIKVIVCDEAQDFTHLDVKLIRHWASYCEMIVMAGDRCQALYSWIGADPKAFIPDSLPDEEITTLGQSYRVPEAVREYASAWLEQDTDMRRFPYAARLNDKGEVVKGVVKMKPGLNLNRVSPLIDELEARAEEGHRVMVLATCRFQLARLCSQMKLRGVPFWNPYREKEGAWNPMRGGPDRLAGFLRPLRPEMPGDEPWSWDELKRWVHPIRARGTLRNGAVSEIDSRAKHHAEDPTQEDLRLLMVPEAYEAMHEAAAQESVIPLLDWYEERMLKAHEGLMRLALAIARKGDPTKLTEQPKIIVGTFHSVKGGDSDVVYLSPDLGGAAMKEWLNHGEPEGRNAIVRAFYVGMTRARKAIALMGATSRNAVEWI